MVDAPLAEAAVVRAFAMVPVVTFDPLIADTLDPSPIKKAPVIAPALNSPDVPLNTIVLAPLAVAAEVRALAMVPVLMLDALIALSAEPLPDMLVNVPVVPVITFPAKEPLASLATIVEAPFALAAVVLALSIVPVEILDALIALIAEPLPEKAPLNVVAVIVAAAKFPPASLATIVLAPLAEAAVVLSLAIVPVEILLALIAEIAAPLPVNDAPVIAPALNSPDAPRNTIVFAPLAVAAVVRALAMVPELMFDALMLVRAAPLPDIAPLKVVAVIVLAAKLPPASLATIVEAPLAEAAVVLALSIVPVEMLDALMAEIAEPLPVNKEPVIAPAANSPDAPRRTIVLAPLLEEAVVLAFAIVPEEMLEALIFDPPDRSPITAAVTVLAEKLPPESR